MIRPTSSSNSPLASDAPVSVVANNICLTIQTGLPDCEARFYPSLYQLTLVKEGVEEKVDLGFAGCRLLERLAQTPGEVVDREDLMSHAWPGRVVGQGSLNQQIYTLRQALGDEKNRDIIQTLPRRGYQLNPHRLMPTPLNEPAPPPSPPPPPTPSQHIAPEVKRPRKMQALLGFGALGVVGLSALLYFVKPSAPVELSTSKLLFGKVAITVMDANEERLHHVVQRFESVAHRLEQLSSRPTQLLLRLSGDFFELQCLQPDGSARSFMFHTRQLGQVADEQLQKCLL